MPNSRFAEVEGVCCIVVGRIVGRQVAGRTAEFAHNFVFVVCTVVEGHCIVGRFQLIEAGLLLAAAAVLTRAAWESREGRLLQAYPASVLLEVQAGPRRAVAAVAEEHCRNHHNSLGQTSYRRLGYISSHVKTCVSHKYNNGIRV